MQIPWPGGRRPPATLTRLREAMLMSRVSESLMDLPERYAQIFELFSSPHIHPKFREDIHLCLAAAADTALALANPTYPVATATEAISTQLTILARILGSLSERPIAHGYAVLLPTSQQLVGAFTTEAEARQHAELLCELGGKTCEVVPVQITSTVALQPRRIGAPLTSVTDDLEFPNVVSPNQAASAHPNAADSNPPNSSDSVAPSDLSPSPAPVLPAESPVSPPNGTQR